MFCPSCGNDCGNANFCSNCGFNLKGTVATASAADSVPDKKTEMVRRYEKYMPNKLAAVKALRADTGMGLKEAVQTIDDLFSDVLPPSQYTLRQRTAAEEMIRTANTARQYEHEKGYVPAQAIASAPKSIYQPVTVNGQEIDVFKVVCKYGVNNERAYSYLKRQFGIPREQAKELLAPYCVPMNANKPSHKNIFSEAADELAEKRTVEAKRKKELEASGQVYCPKCLSTSISANQKGFGFVRGALGANLGLDVGLIAGGIGSKKVICTCLKCGYQWKAGKK